MSGPVEGGAAAGRDLLQALRSGRIRDPRARLRAATDLLEGTFYQELFKAMRATVPEGGVLPGGGGRDVFEGLLDQHVADAAAARSAGGIGEALYRHFLGRVAGAPPEEGA